MSRFCLQPLARVAGFFCVAALLLTGGVLAESAASPSSSQTPASSSISTVSSSGWSSSLAGADEIAEFRTPEVSAALPSAPAPSSAAGGQYNSGGGTSRWSGLAFEAGFGFNPPESNSINYGWNLQIGAGLHAGSHLTPLIEYQYVHTGLAQYIINQVGTQSGNVHIWSFGIDPVFDIAPKASNDFYIKGGGGFYRKVTNFTNPSLQQYCSYYGCYLITVNQVVAHYSSNQGGWNIGGGYYHRFGGIYGTGKMKFFAEARYLDVLTPAVTADNSSGSLVTQVPADTKLIPVTFGFSW